MKILLSSKSTRRSMFIRRKRVNHSLILSLPHEILHKILLKAGEVSHRQFQRTKRACHTFRVVMEEDWYCREVDLWEMETYDWPNKDYEDLRERCLQLENPSAMYVRGVTYLLSQANVQEGLNLIRQASEKGYDLAIYADACLRRFTHPRDRSYGKMSRAFIKEVRKKLSKDTSTPWGNTNLRWLVEMKAQIDVSSIERCTCIPNSGWHLPFKGPGACDECFWKAEAWCFADKLTTGKLIWS